MKQKVYKILGTFKMVRPLATFEATNRMYKTMVLPILEYRDAVWHNCGQENSETLERLQRRVSKLVHPQAMEFSSETILRTPGGSYCTRDVNLVLGNLFLIAMFAGSLFACRIILMKA